MDEKEKGENYAIPSWIQDMYERYCQTDDCLLMYQNDDRIKSNVNN